MKRLAILAIFILALVSQACQRKQYALFDDLSTRSYLYQQKSSPIVTGELSPFADADTTGTLIEKRQMVVSQPISALLKEENPQRASTKKKPVKAKKLAQQKAKPSFQEKTDEPKPLPSRGLGIASLVFGAVGSALLIPSLLTLGLIGFAFAGFLLGLTGLVLGTIRTIRLKKNPDERTEKKAALIGLILSSIAMVVGIMLLGIIALVSLFSALTSYR